MFRRLCFGGLLYFSLLFNISLAIAHAEAAEQIQAASLEPLLTTISHIPELSKFYSLIATTGDDGKKPGPDLEERFNLREESLNFTVLAPTNDAFNSLPPSVITILTSAPNYPFLLALIRTHIAEGSTSPDHLLSPQGPIEAIEGFPISISSSGQVTSNSGLTKTDNPISIGQAQIHRTRTGRPVSIPASNGIIYKMDKILDPWITYFGEDSPSSGPAPKIVSHRKGTMSEYILSNPHLTRLAAILERADPDFLLTRLSQSTSTGDEITYFAPSNAAFEVLPQNSMDKALESGNAVLTSWLLSFILCEGGGGDRKFVSEKSGFTVRVGEGGRKVSNARIEERVCLENGCVSVAGRWLDPLYGVL